jgi:hypothetical protein
MAIVNLLFMMKRNREMLEMDEQNRKISLMMKMQREMDEQNSKLTLSTTPITTPTVKVPEKEISEFTRLKSAIYQSCKSRAFAVIRENKITKSEYELALAYIDELAVLYPNNKTRPIIKREIEKTLLNM